MEIKHTNNDGEIRKLDKEIESIKWYIDYWWHKFELSDNPDDEVTAIGFEDALKHLSYLRDKLILESNILYVE